MKALLNFIDTTFDNPDLGKLVLRVSFAAMFLLHGIHKVFGGTAFIQGLLEQHGVPGFVAYGVYLGEVVAPILLILGLFTRVAAIFVIGTCGFVFWLMHGGDLFTLNKLGAWAAEDIGVYLFSAIAILLLGPGKYALEGAKRSSSI